MIRSPAMWVATASLLLLAFAPGCSKRDPAALESKYRHVVLIVLDTLHAAHLGAYDDPHGASPAIDAFARDGLVFDRAFSNHTWTLPSTASLMTGRIQERHRVVVDAQALGKSLTTLAESFGSAGYDTAAFVQMVYASQAFGLDRGFERFVYSGAREEGRSATLGQVMERVATFDGASRPTFTYVHLRRPHSPYDPAPDLRARFCRECPLADGRHDDKLRFADGLKATKLPPLQQAHAVHLYRGNLATIDREIAPLLAALAARDDALVVLTSDHGEEFGEHGLYGHGVGLTAAAIDVPLIWRGTGIRAGVDSTPASTVDVMPSLLAACAIDAPPGAEFDGISLLPWIRDPAANPRKGPIPLSARHPDDLGLPLVGVVLGDLKAILLPDDRAILVDRGRDRAERQDVSGLHRDAFARMLRYARDLRAGGRGLAANLDDASRLDDDHLADLKALGYVR
jgi:arylsulfatase A-like enzyme